MFACTRLLATVNGTLKGVKGRLGIRNTASCGVFYTANFVFGPATSILAPSLLNSITLLRFSATIQLQEQHEKAQNCATWKFLHRLLIII